jgi:hypothetical protein
MPFRKEFFENLSGLVREYLQTYPCGTVTVTLCAYDREYNLVRVLKCDDTVVTFAYYSSEKSRELSANVQEQTGELKAWPTITVPYDAVAWVEFDPSAPAGQSRIGFQQGP